MNRIAPYAKAIVGAIVAGLGSLYQALDGDPSVVTSQEWIAVAMTTLAALGVVFTIPNADPRGEHQDESVQPPKRDERGATDLLYAVAVVLAVLVVLAILTPVI